MTSFAGISRSCIDHRLQALCWGEASDFPLTADGRGSFAFGGPLFHEGDVGFDDGVFPFQVFGHVAVVLSWGLGGGVAGGYELLVE